MWNWVSENATILQVIVSAVSAVVWVVYLHLLLVGFRQQRQSVLLINRGGSKDEHARCLITNMGSEPIYLVDVIAELEGEGESRYVRVTDRDELGEDEVANPVDRTNQGPLDSGSFIDVGSFYQVFCRAEARLGAAGSQDRAQEITLTAVAASNHAKHLVAGCRSFRVVQDEGDDNPRFVPKTVLTNQIRSWRRRRRLQRMLNDWLDD